MYEVNLDWLFISLTHLLCIPKLVFLFFFTFAVVTGDCFNIFFIQMLLYIITVLKYVNYIYYHHLQQC